MLCADAVADGTPVPFVRVREAVRLFLSPTPEDDDGVLGRVWLLRGVGCDPVARRVRVTLARGNDVVEDAPDVWDGDTSPLPTTDCVGDVALRLTLGLWV